MSYIQNLFTSRDNNATGNTYVGQEGRIWWNPDSNAFYYSDGNTAGGIIITGGSGNSTVAGGNTMVQYNNNSNFAGNANFTYNSVTSTLYVNNIVANTISGAAGPGGPTNAVQVNAGNGQFAGSSGFVYDSGNSNVIITDTTYASDIYAVTNNASSLGSASSRFYDLWLGSGNINLIDDTLNINQEINAQGGNLVITGGHGLKFGQFAIYGNTIATQNPVANINIGVTGDTGYLDIERPVSVNSTGSGVPAFTVQQTGLVAIYVGTQAANTVGALSITGSTGNLYQPVKNSGGMIHVTGNDGAVSRITNDAFGTGSFPAYISRAGRGTAGTPSAVQTGDILSRYSTVAWGTTDFAGGSSPAATNIEVYARENFTDSTGGTEYRIFTAPVGSVTKTLSTTIANNGISFANSSTQTTAADIGITFRDGTRQTTAFIPGNAVSTLTAAQGITLSSSTGDITIGTTAVLGVNGTTNQINVANVGNILTLSLPQNLNTTANIQLNQLTVNDLIILGNVSNVVPSVVGGKIIYVANTATNFAGIDVSGIVTGNAANGVYAGMLYNTTSNTWQMDIGNSNGITSDQVYATDIIANGTIHLGAAYNNYDFPNALLQGDDSVDSYSQFVLKNHSQTASASADFVAVANNGDDTAYYIDMGMNSNVYANVDYAVTGANDGYLYVNGGNLVIGTQTGAKVIKFFTDGTDNVSNVRLTINSTGITTPGNITGSNVIANTAAIGGLVSATGNVIGGNLVTVGTANVSVLAVVAQATIGTTLSAAGNITGANIRTGGSVSATANVVGGNLTTGGQVSAAANITGGNIITGGAVSAVGAVSATGNVTGGNVNTGGNVVVSGLITATGNIVTSANLVTANTVINSSISTSGNITGANIRTGGLVSATGNVIGGNLVGQNLTAGRVAIVGGGKEVSDDADFTYNATTNVLSVAGNINAANFNGNVISTGNISTTANVTGNWIIASGGNTLIDSGVSTTGNVTGNYFIGNGSQLTHVITTVLPTTLSSTVHIAASTVGNTVTLITDATTANTANTIVVRDASGTINVGAWTINARTSAANTTATVSDYWIGLTAKNLVVTLPNAANGAVQGRQYVIVDCVQSGAPNDTIAAQAGDTVVGGGLTQQGQSKMCVYIAATSTWYCN